MTVARRCLSLARAAFVRTTESPPPATSAAFDVGERSDFDILIQPAMYELLHASYAPATDSLSAAADSFAERAERWRGAHGVAHCDALLQRIDLLRKLHTAHGLLTRNPSALLLSPATSANGNDSLRAYFVDLCAFSLHSPFSFVVIIADATATATAAASSAQWRATVTLDDLGRPARAAAICQQLLADDNIALALEVATRCDIESAPVWMHWGNVRSWWCCYCLCVIVCCLVGNCC